MLTTISARDARDGFTDLLGRVYYSREPVAVEKKGKVVAVVLNPDAYASLKKAAKNSLFGLIDRVGERNKDLDPGEVYREVTGVVEEVRQSRYAKDK